MQTVDAACSNSLTGSYYIACVFHCRHVCSLTLNIPRSRCLRLLQLDSNGVPPLNFGLSENLLPVRKFPSKNSKFGAENLQSSVGIQFLWDICICSACR